MASNAYVLVRAALMVFFERADSPSVTASATECLRQILSSMGSGVQGSLDSVKDSSKCCLVHIVFPALPCPITCLRHACCHLCIAEQSTSVHNNGIARNRPDRGAGARGVPSCEAKRGDPGSRHEAGHRTRIAGRVLEVPQAHRGLEHAQAGSRYLGSPSSFHTGG